jgi:Zn-finger nucleic acid-binding protein
MQHIVACPQCKRQYAAPRLKSGTRFRCRCGKVLSVAKPRGHDSRVVRCSACGAARQEEARACAHCGGDFTLHERDLHTVCPQCLTRVSDRAKYCHSCGSPLCPEEKIGASTSLLCPACRDDSHLHSRSLGTENVSVLECDACTGLWIGNDAFRHLARQAHRTQQALAGTNGGARRRDAQEKPPPLRAGYRPCPRCKELMNRRTYGRRRDAKSSGVIIDYCRLHGAWFDGGELADVLEWLREGGRPEAAAPKRRKRPEASTRVLKGDGPPLTSIGDAYWIDNDLGNVFSSRSAVGSLIGLLFNIR